MQALALGLIVASIVLVRGGIKGLNPADAFRDVFSHVPALNVSPPMEGSSRTPGAYIGTGNPANPTTTFPPNVERWRGLVSQHFPSGEVNRALRVIQCESSGNPTALNRSSNASGLFQHLPKYWAGRSAAAGVRGANIMDPVANVKVAAWLYRSRPIPWQDWNASRHCWGEYND